MKNVLIVLLATLFLSGCDEEKNHPTREGKAPQTQIQMKSQEFEVLSPIPEDWVKRFSINTQYYKKMTSAWGIPIVASNEVDDVILKNAGELLANQLSDESLVNGEQVRDKLWQHYLKVAIFPSISNSGGTKQLPEFSGFPSAGGYGATKEIPTMGMSDLEFDFQDINSNALGNTFSHELTHSIHLLAGSVLPSSFEEELTSAYKNAQARGVWPSDAYINANRLEYLAEGAEFWFNWRPDYAQEVDRNALLNNDPDLYSVLNSIYRENSELFFSGSTSFVQPIFTAGYTFTYTGSDIDEVAPKYKGRLLSDGKPIRTYYSVAKSEPVGGYRSWGTENISISFGPIPFPDSDILNDIYKHHSYQFVIDNEAGERVLDCSITQENIIAEVQNSDYLDLNTLESYCSIAQP